jgi:hypothetical protein
VRLAVENWPRWFAAYWPNAARRWKVLNGYRGIDKETLADIALRNSVFAPIREGDAHKAAIAEGRRQCALEIFKLANVDVSELFERTRILKEERQK